MLRAGVAGVGSLGKMHTASLLTLSDLVSVDALADPVEERRSGKSLKTQGLNLGLGEDESATAEGVRQYDDYRPLCEDENLDVVFIATPSDLHADAAIMALENGKHVFTEKPLALSYEDCLRVVDAAKASGRTLMVGHCLRFYPEYEAAWEIMKSGRYGKVVAAVMSRHGGTPGGWFREVARSGGVNLDLQVALLRRPRGPDGGVVGRGVRLGGGLSTRLRASHRYLRAWQGDGFRRRRVGEGRSFGQAGRAQGGGHLLH